MVRILDLDDLSTHNRHVDQIRYNEVGQSDHIPIVSSVTNETLLDSSDDVLQSHNIRHSERLQLKPRINYKNPEINLRCGGCDDC